MKKNLSILLIMLVLSVSCILAQDKISRQKTDFSGTWILDKKASANYLKNHENYTVNISQNGEQIQIARNYAVLGKQVHFTLTLSPDRRGEKNFVPFGTDEVEIKSDTYWNKNQLYHDFTYFRNFSADRSNIFLERFIERYKLSDDGTELTIYSEHRSSTRVSGNGNTNNFFPITSKMVFRKADG